MFVTTIEYVGRGHDGTISDPEWAVVETALREIDGDLNDGVILQSAGDSYMGISGGENGRYVVAGFLAGFGSFICADGDENGSPLDVVVAGDFNTYPSNNVIGIEIAVSAAEVFFDCGELSKQFKWEKQ